MCVVVTQEFLGKPDGQVYGRPILVGEELTGDLAELALREGWAKEQKPPKAVAPKPEGESAA
jgi:hypothetical protein